MLIIISNMYQAVLKQFGLSEKEVDVYLALLKYGMQTTSLVAKRTNLNRGTTFLILKDLVKKGLATKIIKNEVQYHSPVSPQYLNSLLERKREELLTLEKNLRDSLPLLNSLQNPLSSKPKIRFFEGKEGLRTLLEDTLTPKDKKLFGLLSMADLYDVFGEKYFEDYVNRRIDGSVFLQVLRNKEKDIKKRWNSNPLELRELRHLPENMVFPATMYLYDGKVAFISSEKEEFGLLIESEEIFEIQKKLFDSFWQTCKSE